MLVSLKQKISLSEIRKLIPKSCYEKSLPRSLMYMARDLLLLSTSFFVFPYISDSYVGLFVYWNVYGFLMWCLFVVGHDCGHGSFSKYPIINDICGHICHTLIFVPFYPWAFSHKQHHQYHNHKEKDKSHPWFTEEEIQKTFLRRRMKSVFTPFIVYAVYLYLGEFDGSHIYPFGKLYENAPKKERLRCAVSTVAIFAFVGALFLFFDSWKEFFLFYGGAWLIFSFWLFMVTYMQHHEEETVIFDDTSWDFMSGALETIDRSFGFGIDKFHHNITDGHVVHHLLFTQIPHYNLKKATESIKPILNERYKHQKHKLFILDFWKLFFKVSFSKWTLKQNVKKPSQKSEKVSK